MPPPCSSICPDPLAIGVVVAVGTLIGAVRWMGTMGSWVPISGLFVLVLGGDDPAHFVLGYLGLTSVGALVGAATNVLLPPVHLVRTRQAQDALRAALADQLDTLADVLDGRGAAERAGLGVEASQHARPLVGDGGAAGHGHRWAAGQLAGAAGQAREPAAAGPGPRVGALALQVDEMTDVLSARERDDREDLALPASVRPAAAQALRATADALRGAVDERDERWDAAWAAERALAAEVRRCRARTGDDLFAAGGLVSSIERTLTTMGPAAAA